MDTIVNLLLAACLGCGGLLFGLFLWVVIDVLVVSAKMGRLP